MGKSFQIDLSVDPKLIIAKAKELAAQAGGKFDGNTEKGMFTHNGILGEYEIQGKRITITIHQKPFILPWKLVTDSVQKWFQQTEFEV
jgi:hypothetical protein